MQGNHVKHMLIGGGALLVVLLVAGVPLGNAVPVALALACPLMMIFMMRSMGGHRPGHGNGHDHTGQDVTAGPARDAERPGPPSPEPTVGSGGVPPW